MRALLDLMDPEWLWTLIILVAGGAGAWLEWKREGSELRELRTDVEVLKQSTVKLEDWSDMSARQTVIEKLTAKLLDEWEGGEDAGD
jgi:hypothetical protein